METDSKTSGEEKITAPLPQLLDDCFSPKRFGALLALLILVQFWEIALGSKNFFYRDYGVLAYPVLHYEHVSFWRGELPLWNPFSNCGAPFLAQWGTMVLYPFSLLYLLLPLPWSAGLFSLAHLFLAGLGMYFLAQKWTKNNFAASVAGLTFVFNGVTLSCLTWPNYMVALGWMPWVVVLAERAWRTGGARKIILAGVVSAFQILAGVPEIVLLTWLFLGCLFLADLVREKNQRAMLLRRIGLIVLIAAGLTAAQLLPFLDLLQHSQRDRNFATGKWALAPWGWANFFVPLFHCFMTPEGTFFQVGQEFFSSTYLGITPLIFAVFAAAKIRETKIRLMTALVLVSIILALGSWRGTGHGA